MEDAVSLSILQRYRICDVHLKMDVIVRDNEECRFCQQCGRFHSLSAFDNNKRSCRERLLKHNARRRRR
ncbi:squamosa promoter binding protein, partial [Haematococcus lacustris]